MRRMTWVWAVVAMIAASAVSQAAEWNPVRREPLRIGPEASRIIVGFKATAANATTTTVRPRLQAQAVRIVEARTTRSDVLALTQRTGVAVARSRQITPDMHVLYLPRRLYGGDVLSTLAKLRA
ncbi:MAG: hypothetical protein KGL34_08295, partial [Gammaproteobacteria bacterium]|nr:hypothetical protein [Gammaproteobacteria bacterium]